MKLFIIIISIFGIMYVPWKLISLYHHLLPVEGTVTKVQRTSDRMSYYEFYAAEYPNTFYNAGTGILSFFKDDERTLKFNVNRQIKFYINSNDHVNFKAGKKVVYMGLQDENIFIDMFYYHFSKLSKIPFFICCLLMMSLNFDGVFIAKSKINEFLSVVYLILGVSVLIL